MSREIKFRAWDKGRKEFLSGGQILLSIEKGRNPQNGFYLDIFDERYKDKYKDRFVLQQYTGLKDKNEKGIYEGDIIRYADDLINKEKIDEVKYNETHAAFCRLHKSEMGLQYLFIDEAVANKCEVIGNIFDNPELLGGDSD